MTTVYDVKAEDLIADIALKIKKDKNIAPPAWNNLVKTGVNRTIPPHDKEWWYVRLASILRRVYLDGPVGISRLRSFYGGKHRKGVRRNRFVKSSGMVIRTGLKQLETAGYIDKSKKGRKISVKGQSFLDNTAHEIMQKYISKKTIPGIEKY